MVECKGKTIEDCWNCSRYHSSHSEHYCQVNKQKVSNINCSIGGYKTFDSNGNEIK